MLGGELTNEEYFLELVEQGDLNQVKSMLFGRYGNPNLAILNNNYPLILSCLREHLGVACVLLNFNADPNTLNSQNLTPYIISFNQKSSLIFQAIVKSDQYIPFYFDPNDIRQKYNHLVAQQVFFKFFEDRSDWEMVQLFFREGGQSICALGNILLFREKTQHPLQKYDFIIPSPDQLGKFYTNKNDLILAISKSEFSINELRTYITYAQRQLDKLPAKRLEYFWIENALFKMKDVCKHFEHHPINKPFDPLFNHVQKSALTAPNKSDITQAPPPSESPAPLINQSHESQSSSDLNNEFYTSAKESCSLS